MRFSNRTWTAERRFVWLAAWFPIAIFLPPASAQFTQQGPKLVATGSLLGFSAALSADGSTAILGAPDTTCDISGLFCQGGAWVYTRANGVWTQQGLGLTADDAAGSGPDMGDTVALSADGNTAIVGGPLDNLGGGACYTGAAWVFIRVNGEWFQQGSKLLPSPDPCAYGVVTFGSSVALSADGNTALVGGPGSGGLDSAYQSAIDGGAWVFTRANGVWTQQAKLQDPRGVTTSRVTQGYSVALSGDGNTAFVGDPKDSNKTGAVWVFTRSNGVWSSQGNKLVGMVGTGSSSQQGSSVALSADGSTGVVGATFGGMWVFTRNNGVWSQQGGPLPGTAADGTAVPGSPVALSADGNTAITGGPAEYAGGSGALVFTRDNLGAWSQFGPKLTGTGAVGNANQGGAVALNADGTTAIVGGAGDNNEAGAAWVFIRQPPSGPASPGAANPASGTGLSQSMSFTFNDPRGWQDLDVVNILINNFLDGRNACYLAYSRSAGVLYLLEDNGGTLSPALTLGASGSVSNSQCTVAGAASAASGSGNTLTLTLNMSFSAGFAGNKILYLAARDLEGGNSGWQALGTWQVPYTPSGTIVVGSLTPARAALASGTAQTLTSLLVDSKGAGDFGVVNLLVNNFIDGRQACYLAYAAATNSLLLVDDSGDAGGPFAGSMTLNGSAATIQNSQCSVNGTGSSAVKNGNNLTLTLNITFKSPFAGNHIVWVAGRDAAGANNTDWQAVGTTTVQ
ncbi:conserved exported hypothetical protein [Candidatus Sulfopaludibacter sp. SbA4]|nr:conserved exported hypothetical protein [Candidatus Sulfopaludibacter sp. SbA4]